MSRRLRVEFPGAIYHVINRGDRREDIFRDDTDRQRFLKTMEETCDKTDWLVHAFCLMNNHFHIVLETPNANLVTGMKWFLGTYTSRFNHRHKIHGHLFGGRYKSLLVGGEGGYLSTVVDYVHLNPDRAGALQEKDALSDYAWSSFPSYLKDESARPAWLCVQRVLGEHGIPKDNAAGRAMFEKRTEIRRHEDHQEDYEQIRSSWCFGDEPFRKDLLNQISEKKGLWQFGPEFKETSAEKAERLIQNELTNIGWEEEDLGIHRKGDPIKIQIAQKLRSETTVTLQWIAERLQMGTKSHLVHLLYWKDRKKPKAQAKQQTKRSKPPQMAHSNSRIQNSPQNVPSSESVPAREENSSILLTDPVGFDVSFD